MPKTKNGRATCWRKFNNESEVEVVRVRITLACTECKQRNYNMTKDKKTHPDRMETKKYCRFCKRHTVHKETKLLVDSCKGSEGYGKRQCRKKLKKELV